MSRLLALAAAFVLTTHGFGQPTPRGTHFYLVEGVFEGQAMEPWDAAVTVRDTTVNGKAALFTRYQSRRAGASYRFDYSAMWSLETGEGRSTWIGNGRAGPQSCDVSFARTHVDNRPVIAPAIPEFAIGPVIASLPLGAGATMHFTLFRCDADEVKTFDFVGVTSVITHPATKTRPEERVFKVTGSAGYPAEVFIAESDRQVLRVVRPQGTVGSSIETYTSSRR